MCDFSNLGPRQSMQILIWTCKCSKVRQQSQQKAPPIPTPRHDVMLYELVLSFF